MEDATPGRPTADKAPESVSTGVFSELTISREEIQKLLAEKRERLKGLGAINQTTRILKQSKPLQEMVQEICKKLPGAWHYPDDTVARIHYGDRHYVSSGKFRETQWRQKKSFETIDAARGS